MDVIILEGSRKTLAETNFEVREAIQTALELVKDKRGFRTHTETWWDCKLKIILGHNIYTTSIIIEPDEKVKKRKWIRWYNGYAYYCNGVFWSSISRCRVELI